MKRLGSFKRILLGCLAVLAFVNLSAFFVFESLLQIDSSKPLQLVPRNDALVIISRGILGNYRYKIINDWIELEQYLESRQLSLQVINDVSNDHNLEAKIINTKIIWGTLDSPKVLEAPDYLSVKNIYPFVKFGSLEGSILGHAILITPKTPSS